MHFLKYFAGILLLIISAVSCGHNNYSSLPTSAFSPDTERYGSSESVFNTLSLTFAGDIMAHDVNYNRPPYSKIYEHVAPYLLSDDLSFGNLEFPCDPEKPMSNFPCFNVHLPQSIFLQIIFFFTFFFYSIIAISWPILC